jgi:hypothetical protein
MPVSPAVLKSISTIRKALATAGEKGRERFELSTAVRSLFENSGEIAGDTETLRAVLAFAPEIEAFRGKGSQDVTDLFSRSLYSLVYDFLGRLPASEIHPDFFPRESESPPGSEDVFKSLEALGNHAFERVQGSKVRSRLAAGLRSLAWGALCHIADVLRRPAHLAHALEVAGNSQASTEERDGAVQYLVAYWADEEPDEPTVSLLNALEKDPPTRDFLITVLQAQIDLGLNNEFGALASAENWDEENDND